MSETRATGPLPPDVEARVRAYLAAFLPPEAVDEAVDEVASDSGFWGDTDDTEILAVAHAVLASRLRVATDVEVLVLNEDVGLSVPEIAATLALPQVQVRRVLDHALAVLADVDDRPRPSAGPAATDPGMTDPGVTDAGPSVAAAPDVRRPPPSPDDPAVAPPAPASVPTGPVPSRRRRRRQRVLVLTAALGVVVVALVAAWVVGRDGGCPAGGSLCITQAVLTDAVDPSTGAPGPDRTTFAVDEPVTLWFGFERQRPDAGPLEVRWYREGTLLYATDVRIGSGDRLNVSLAGLWSDAPGRYRVEVAEEDHLLLERDFRIEE